MAKAKQTGRTHNGGVKEDSSTRERIFHMAAELFTRNGYDATGVQELGDAVGLGRGALYHHIGSKENLLYQISIRHVYQMVEEGEEILASDQPADEKFRRLGRRLMAMIAENLPEITVFFHEHRSLSKQHNEELIDIRDQFENVWVRILEQGVEEGIFRPMPPVAIKGILGLFNYSYVWFVPNGKETPEHVADIFADMAISGMKPR
ncbi:MAG TPA: TetR/AcrR family transcriptional regulator [Solirubrobacterales bacterium]|jgi:AcrR family transcriptional regulator|nr:TetR/AcrR family transcriptional regulator [Solirubrobacterales bacterium]